MLPVEIIYIPLNAPAIHLHLEVSEGATVQDALNKSGIFNTHPEVRGLSVGIFSKKASLDTVVKNGDRIEIYRPLLINPMEKRRQRSRD